jgi:hypothetical protein
VFENWENTQFPKCHTDKMRYWHLQVIFWFHYWKK